MGANARTGLFLKDCMADAVIKLLNEKELSKITVDEIARTAGVNRSTWFRNFSTKNEAITYKLLRLWEEWSKSQNITLMKTFDRSLAHAYFSFTYSNKELLKLLYDKGLFAEVYRSCIRILSPSEIENDALTSYRKAIKTAAVFGLFDEWVKRDFKETPEELTNITCTLLNIQQ